MTLAEPHANLHLTPERQPCQHPTTQFLQKETSVILYDTANMTFLSACGIHLQRTWWETSTTTFRSSFTTFQPFLWNVWRSHTIPQTYAFHDAKPTVSKHERQHNIHYAETRMKMQNKPWWETW